MADDGEPLVAERRINSDDVLRHRALGVRRDLRRLAVAAQIGANDRVIGREARGHHVPGRVRARVPMQEHHRRPSPVSDAQRRTGAAVDMLDCEPVEERHAGTMLVAASESADYSAVLPKRSAARFRGGVGEVDRSDTPRATKSRSTRAEPEGASDRNRSELPWYRPRPVAACASRRATANDGGTDRLGEPEIRLRSRQPLERSPMHERPKPGPDVVPRLEGRHAAAGQALLPEFESAISGRNVTKRVRKNGREHARFGAEVGNAEAMRMVVVGATGNVGTALLRSLAEEPVVDSILGIARRLPESGPAQDGVGGSRHRRR